MMNRKHLSVIFFVSLPGALFLSLLADWGHPDFFTTVPFSFFLLFLYALRTFFCCMAGVSLAEPCTGKECKLPVFAVFFLPAAVYGVFVFCNAPFGTIVLFADAVYYVALLFCGIASIVFIRNVCAAFSVAMAFSGMIFGSVSGIPDAFFDLAAFCLSAAGFVIYTRTTIAVGTEQVPVVPAVICPGLSRREEDVADLLLKGKTTGEIAAVLFISNTTVKTHIQNIFRKYEVRNRMEFAHKVSSFSSPDE
jgi:DNA-binding CsgD family transcriptional regulator